MRMLHFLLDFNPLGRMGQICFANECFCLASLNRSCFTSFRIHLTYFHFNFPSEKKLDWVRCFSSKRLTFSYQKIKKNNIKCFHLIDLHFIFDKDFCLIIPLGRKGQIHFVHECFLILLNVILI